MGALQRETGVDLPRVGGKTDAKHDGGHYLASDGKAVAALAGVKVVVVQAAAPLTGLRARGRGWAETSLPCEWFEMEVTPY